MNEYAKIAFNGLIKNNPSFKLALGTCASLALSSTAFNGLGMGLSVTAVLLVSNFTLSLLRKVIPHCVRIPAFVTVIATLVTVLRMVLERYLPSLYGAMGIFLPLIVVNCVILGRAEAFASKNPLLKSVVDGLATGLGFTLALTIMGILREVMGNGTLFGIRLWEFKIGFFATSAGAFFTYAVSVALFLVVSASVERAVHARRAKKLRTGGLNV